MEAGTRPIAAAIAAIENDLSCSSEPCRIASRSEPVFAQLRMRETRITPPRTETPNNEMNPTAAEMLKLVRVTSSDVKPPMSASGDGEEREEGINQAAKCAIEQHEVSKG